MPTFQCTNCNYELDKPEAPDKCPYCGEEGKIQPYKTAQDFLDEDRGN